ncbi:MAG: DUF1273 domain-containing protein [Clostridiales bacterium]|nr:DUF1273 domain-containing protein [Clostridiales bacterium]
MNRIRTMAFAGHRPESLPFGENELSASGIMLKAKLLTEIMDRVSEGCNTFYCGAARGSDIIFAEQLLLLKATEYPSIKLICVLPHEDQAKRWTENWRERYFRMLERADETVLMSARYTKDCYRIGNRYMIDSSDALLAVYNGSHTGGTAAAIQYARRKNKEIIVIDPST